MINLPWPPSNNHYYTVARGRKILSKRGRAYKKECAIEIMRQLLGKRGVASTTRYCVTIYARPPDKRKRDLDNLIKPILDALVEGKVIYDDSQIDDLRIQRFDPVKGGSIQVLIS